MIGFVVFIVAVLVAIVIGGVVRASLRRPSSRCMDVTGDRGNLIPFELHKRERKP